MFSGDGKNGGKRQSKRLFYHHGYGGGGPVTKGLIDFNRTLEWVEEENKEESKIRKTKRMTVSKEVARKIKANNLIK